MTDTKNLRAWVETWGRELTWTDHAGAKAGSISKDEMIAILDIVDKRLEFERQMLNIIGSQHETITDLRNHRDHLAGQLEKAARVDSFNWCIDLLRRCATDPGAAKNYASIEFKWDEAIAPGLPFKRCAVVFFREDGKGPATLVGEALTSRDKLAKFARSLLVRLEQAGESALVCADWLRTIDELASQPDANQMRGSEEKLR